MINRFNLKDIVAMTKTLPNTCFWFTSSCKNLLTLLLLFVMGLGHAQIGDYEYDNSLEADTGFPYTPIVGTDLFGPNWNLNVDNNVPIGFDFVFNGILYTNCKVSSAGFIAFGGSANLPTNWFDPIARAANASFDGTIAAYGRRLAHANFGSAPLYTGLPTSVRYDTQGSPGNRVFIVQWENAVRQNGTLATTPLPGLMNFQIRLYEADYAIEIHWGPVGDIATINTLSTTANYVGQCGIRGVANNPSPDERQNRQNNAGLWTVTNNGTGNGNGMNLRRDQYPTYTFRLRWNAPCLAPGAPVVSNVQSTSADVNWAAPAVAPSGGYDWMVVSSGENPNAVTPSVIEASGNTTNNFITPLTGLPGGTIDMVFWVRSNCGGSSASDWIPSGFFTTSCDPTNVPYFVGFTGAQLPNIMPPCTSQVNPTGLPWVVNDNQTGMNGRHLQYTQSGVTAANAWFFTQGVNLTAGQAYRISYRYGSQFLPSLSNRLEVRYGTIAGGSPLPSDMTLPIDNHPDFRGSPFLNTAVFVPPATGVYYFGFRVYSNPGQGNVWLDDILVEESNCNQPQNVTVGTVGSNSAFISWDPVTPAPLEGYQYYVSTSATPPLASTPPTGIAPGNFINLTGLEGDETYYFWVRSNCSTLERSIWSAVETFITDPALPYCIPVANTLTANITNFTTTGGLSNINNSSGGSITSPGYSDYTSLAVTQVQGGTVNFSLSQTTGGHGIAIWVDWNQDGVFQATERVYNTTAYQFGTTVIGSFNVPLGATLGNTRMRVMVDYWSTNPSNPCAFNLASGQLRGEVEDYSFIVVVAPPALTLNMNSSSQCAGDSSPVVNITSNIADYDTYVWIPSTGVTDLGGGSYQFAANSTVIYTLSAAQSSAPFSINTVTYTYNAIAPPTPIVITPSPATICEAGPAVALTASGGIVAGIVALEETFEGGAPNWTFINNSSGGNGPAVAAWTIHNSPYNVVAPTNTWGAGAFISNDNSSFVFTNSDAQGSGSTTSTIIESPVFSLDGFSNASLSFWHYFRQWAGSFGAVEISTDGGLTWPAAQTLVTYTVNTGTRDNFSNTIINLNSYLGFSNLKIRFRYFGNWGYGWAVDNIRVEGSAATEVFWSPAAGLFVDAAATIPYNPTVALNTVYALPTVNTTYTATVATPPPFGCTTTQTVDATISVVTQGTISADQSICNGLPADVTLSGQVGTVVRWESATNPAFTAGVTAITNTSTTLTGAEMMPIADVKYFRAIVSNGVCEKPTNVVAISYITDIFDGSSWDSGFGPDTGTKAIFDVPGNYTISSYLEACSLEIISGNITVASGVTLYVENELIVAPGATLTFENNASLLQLNDTEPNVGSIIYRRNSTGMYLLDYTYWSSPVQNQDLFTFSPFTQFLRKYEWNGATQQWVQLFPNSASHVPGNVFSTAGRGFIVRAPGSGPIVFNSHLSAEPRVIFPAEFEGVPNNGDYTVNVFSVGDGFNLLGNPYPSALDIHAFLLDNSALDWTVKFWTHNTPIANNVYNSSDYATYNFTGLTGSGLAAPGFNSNLPTRYIASGQGVVIDALSNGTVTYSNSHRVAGNNTNFFRLAQNTEAISAADAIELQEKNRVWLTMTNHHNLSKELLVGYVENATDDWDRGYDGKFTASGYGLEFYSLLGDMKLAIQGKGLPFLVSDVVPLGYHAQQAGSYTIALTQFDGLFHNQEVYVEDLLTGVIHPLKEGGYTFVTEPGRYDNRFVLRYTNETLGVNTPQFGEHHVVIYKEYASLIIQTQEAEMSEVILYDMSGRRLASQQGDLGLLVRFDQLGIAQQVLMVEIVTRDRGSVFKKYVY